MRYPLNIRILSALSIGGLLLLSGAAYADRNITRTCTGIYGAEIDRVDGSKLDNNAQPAFFGEFAGRGGCRKINRNKCRRNAMSAIFKCGEGQWRLRTGTETPRDCTGDHIEGYSMTDFNGAMEAAICSHPDVASGYEIDARIFVTSFGSTGCGGDRALSFQGASILFPVPPASRGDAEDEAAKFLGNVTVTCGEPREVIHRAAPGTSRASMAETHRAEEPDRSSSSSEIASVSGGLIAGSVVGTPRDTACRDAVQGEIAWDYDGNTNWGSDNLDRLCSGAETSVQPAKCFEQVMHGGVNWGGGTNWHWANALDLCEGTTDADTTIACFEREKRDGWRAAIEACSN